MRNCQVVNSIEKTTRPKKENKEMAPCIPSKIVLYPKFIWRNTMLKGYRFGMREWIIFKGIWELNMASIHVLWIVFCSQNNYVYIYVIFYILMIICMKLLIVIHIGGMVNLNPSMLKQWFWPRLFVHYLLPLINQLKSENLSPIFHLIE